MSELQHERIVALEIAMAKAEAEIARLKEELEKCGNDRAQDQHRLFHVEGIIEDQWRAGEEAVLAFVRNGRFLSDSAPGAQFAREVEAGWKSWGKAEADKARRAEIDEWVSGQHRHDGGGAVEEKSSLDTSRSSFGHEDDHP